MKARGVIGTAIGGIAALGVIAAGVGSGLPAMETFWRAALGAAAGFAAGWWLFGGAGAAVVREAAGKDPAPPSAGTRPPAGT